MGSPQLIRTLSAQHIQVAIAEMLSEQECVRVAGEHHNLHLGGWTMWLVVRPDPSCTDLAQMKLVTITTGHSGETSVHIADVTA